MTGATLASGGGGGAAAWTLPLLQAVAVSSNITRAGKPSRPYRKFRVVLTVVFISILVLKECFGLRQAAQRGASCSSGFSEPTFNCCIRRNLATLPSCCTERIRAAVTSRRAHPKRI